MAGGSLTIRVRTKKGIVKVQSLDANSSFHDLKCAIADLTGMSYSTIKLLNGYPPKSLHAGENDTLNSAAIKDGELLTLDESAASASAGQTLSLNTAMLSSATPSISPRLLGGGSSCSSTSQPTPSVPSGPRPQLSTTKGQLMRKVVPANNSCLFTSVHYVMENGVFDLDCQKSMRELIAKTVRTDPSTFNEAILGKKNSAYCDWIRNPTSWGGSIECMILSKHYKCEICVVDIRTSRIDRFGEDCSYPVRVFIIYDGIHFDPLYLETIVNGKAQVQTRFSTEDDIVMMQATELALDARRSHQFTDVANFKLKCLVCQQPLKGQKAAQEHAEQTGHINFGELNQ